MSFLWIGKLYNKKETVLLLKLMNSITFCEYNNDPSNVPDVIDVIELYPTVFNKDVPMIVSLLIVNKCWALLVEAIMHDMGEPTKDW